MIYGEVYFSEWENRKDNFRLEILKKNEATALEINSFKNRVINNDGTFEAIECLSSGGGEKIEASANLNAKEVDSAISTIRGLGLNIRIDANVDNPFDEFFVINEKEYLVKFYRNSSQMFEGFVDPKGASQPFVQRNWNINLVATDQLASLSNLRFNYDNELPNEFTFLYKILKRTGLDLPIAFFDDVNLRKFNNGSFPC